ncbi:hypothetical protein BDF20DRAFT_838957 [Mycotypha africana]|uniref:uncharacterized protein n=1 Tax=Mycotypha africana TaxID=64632 RepID=UPI0022FFF875|nr:uncharacterized protein BDF20DRAFT_838957 [Mycotypha africana]KAI8968981.1 hypothetical protein BDF20DRAFT_838957 [Mycotypha africana]
MGRSLIAKRPYTYLRYPRLSATEMSVTATNINNDNQLNVSLDIGGVADYDNMGEETAMIADNDSISSAEATENYSRSSIIAILKSLYYQNVQTKSLFDYGFHTTRQIYDDLTTHLPRLHSLVTFETFSKWITDAEFGPRVSARKNGKPVKGRQLYKVRESAAGVLTETSSALRQELNNRGENWALVGYVRKSITKESDENTVNHNNTCTRHLVRICNAALLLVEKFRLLQLMINKLQNRCFCSRIYASPNSPASKAIMERDFDMSERNASIIDSLAGCDGNAQDMLHFLTHTTKRIQLCVISYAGLSTRPDDVECFLRACKMVKSVTIDHDSHIESIDRYALLHGSKEKLEKFKSRNGCIKRSK